MVTDDLQHDRRDAQPQDVPDHEWSEHGDGGIPAHGNQRSQGDAGCRFDFENPEYR